MKKEDDILNNSKKLKIKQEPNEFLLYTTPNGDIKVEVLMLDESIWLTQDKIAELFGVQRPAITKHLKNIFKEGELDESVVSSILEHVTKHGAILGKKQVKKIKYYNLDAIISVGYRVNSSRATQFRIWATERLREYIIKGFTMDDERLKNPNQPFGKDYFEEQLERIRDIRSSERRLYQKITDIYTQCSIDYNLNSKETENFFATVQNKLHWSITGKTAAEIIKDRVNAEKINIGLTTWKNAPKGKIRKTDVVIAKNYLTKDEIDSLNRIVNMYLDYAELQANNKKIMYMTDWIKKLDAFLNFNEKEILTHAGKVSAELAKDIAESEYEKYSSEYDKNYMSDFDQQVKKYLTGI